MYKLGNKRLNLWDEPFMQSQQMTIELKILYLYLLSNALSNIAGVYKITNRRILFDLCNPSLNLKVLFYQLRKMKKVYRCGDYVIIKDAPIYIKKMTKTVIKEMDSILYELPDKIKAKMKHIHYKYAHLYGEPLYEELQKLGVEKKTKTLPINKKNSLSNNDGLYSGLETTKLLHSEDFEKQNTQKEFDIMGGKDERDSKKLEATLHIDENGLFSMENSQEHAQNGANNETPKREPEEEEVRQSVELEEKPCILEDIFEGCKTSNTEEEQLPEEKTLFEFGKNYTPELYNDEPKIRIGLDHRNVKSPFSKNTAEATVQTFEEEAKTKRPTPTKSEIEAFQRNYSKKVFKRFQDVGLYEGIAFSYFYKADFLKGLGILKQRAITVEEPKEAYLLNEVIDAYLEKAKNEKDTNKKCVMAFYKMCEEREYNLLNVVNY